MEYKNRQFNYLNSYVEAKAYLELLRSEGWKLINYTPSRDALPYEQNNLVDVYDNAHTVIGQEFNNVVAVIDEHFYYKSGALSTRNYRKNPYYHPTKMLFQIVSRTRLKLAVIVINNPEVLNRCLEILNQD